MELCLKANEGFPGRETKLISIYYQLNWFTTGSTLDVTGLFDQSRVGKLVC